MRTKMPKKPVRRQQRDVKTHSSTIGAADRDRLSARTRPASHRRATPQRLSHTSSKNPSSGTTSASASKTVIPPVAPVSKEFTELAGIEYVGIPGVSKECQDAILRFLQFGDRVTHARILSSGRDHCLLLTVNVGDLVAVKSGFGSGYLGEGSRSFSCVIQVLESHGAEIEEYAVSPEVIERLDGSRLASADLAALDAARPVRPRRWHDYVFEKDWERGEQGALWRDAFPLVVPFAAIDPRIMDLALGFFEDPDGKLIVGYRRLEDIVRARTALTEHGSKLFSQAFGPNGGKLTWKDISGGEHGGRLSLLTGIYSAYRNRRAHRESRGDSENALRELLLLNQAYHLEGEAVDVVGTSPSPQE